MRELSGVHCKPEGSVRRSTTLSSVQLRYALVKALRIRAAVTTRTRQLELRPHREEALPLLHSTSRLVG